LRYGSKTEGGVNNDQKVGRTDGRKRDFGKKTRIWGGGSPGTKKGVWKRKVWKLKGVSVELGKKHEWVGR